MGNLQILGLFADIIEELRDREITRSNNNPVADYAEHLVCNALSLAPAPKSAKGFDAIGRDGKKYEIKSRRKSVRSNPTRFSAIRDLQNGHFDFLVAVLFEHDFTVKRAMLIPYNSVFALAFHQKHVNGWILAIRDTTWSAEGAVDVAPKLRRIQQKEG